MELRTETVALYCRQAVAGMERALGRFDDQTVNLRPPGEQTNSAAVLIVHACAAALYWFEHVGLGRNVERDRDAEFVAESSIQELRARLVETGERLDLLALEFESGQTATGHELRALLHGGDTSDGSVVLHALEELFQHLGHLESTADAVGNSVR